MARIAGINENDVVNGEGICVSVFLQGCPHRCLGCHNPETWDFNKGEELFSFELNEKVYNYLIDNNIKRNLSILGGEPLCQENFMDTFNLINYVREKLPDIKIFVWTGYETNELRELYGILYYKLLEQIDVLITGRFILAERDITLPLRGSKNQQVLRKGIDF